MRRKIPVTLTAEEIGKIIAQPNKRVPTGLRNKAILSFIWDSGARVSDVINLRPGNLNIAKKEVIIKDGKGGVDRNLSFSDYTGELLKKYKEARPKGDYFFCTLKGNKLDRVYLYSMIRRYAKRIGITKKIGLHTLRHSFALKFYKDSRHDLIRLQKILGHKNINTTEIYCYMDSTDVKKGLEAYYSKRDSKDKNIGDRIKALEEEIQSLKADM
ncbi:MAG: tyrosine-type recombinase/integrase [Actinobacteria bacterium]|nr:tyrosine-type recombinase/integrase [Actinomycetota bacterium]